MPSTQSSTAPAFAVRPRHRNFPPARRRRRPRKATKRRIKPVQTPPPVVETQSRRHVRDAYNARESNVFQLFTRKEVEDEARACGFWQRVPQRIGAFEFVLCCALASVLEAKRGFASVWRLLAAAVNVVVARSTVTQRFGASSAALMERLFSLAVERLPQQERPEILGKLSHFKSVLAQDGSVLQLSPLLKKLFPATQTNSVDAAGKLHATVDVVHRRVVAVAVTGERASELHVARSQGIESGTLYIRDLGYTCHDEFASMIAEEADLLMRLKDNANPTVLKVRHGVVGPRRSEGLRFKDLTLCRTQDTFDLDARFKAFDGGTIDLRVVGHFNPKTAKYHCYVTTLPAEMFSVEELETLYALRWVIELLFKLLKSSCHLDHLDTKDPDALRTHIYASLLAATVLSAVVVAAAQAAGIPHNDISILAVGIAAPLLVVPLLLLWCQRELTPDELAATMLRVVAVGCRDQNRARTQRKWGCLR